MSTRGEFRLNSKDVLQTLAALSGGGPVEKTDVIDADTFTWLTYSALGFFDQSAYQGALVRPFRGQATSPITGSRFERSLNRLISKAALHSGEQLIRLGWVWFAGVVDIEGEATQFCFPAISMPMVRQATGEAPLAGFSAIRAMMSDVDHLLAPAGDAEITPLIKDSALADLLLESASFGDGKFLDAIDDLNNYRPIDAQIFAELPQLMSWCSDVAQAVGLKVEQTFPLHASVPSARRNQPGISMHMGCGLYLASPASQGSRKESLIRLSSLNALEDTAFGKIYGDGTISPGVEREVIALRPLSLRQQRIAGRAGGSDVSVLSGAPGTGKSHVLSVVARDAIARGESVLVVAGSPHAVDVLVEHFAQTPGPTPVTFGGSRHGNRLASELSELISRNEANNQTSSVASGYGKNMDAAIRSLELEREAIRIDQDPSHRIEVVAELDRAGDLSELRQEVEELANPGFLKFGHKKRLARLTARIGPHDDTEERFRELARKRDALRLLSAGGMSLAARLDDLATTEHAAARSLGVTLTNEWISNLGRNEKRTLAQVSSAVTSNRTARRRALAALDPESLTRAAPLWVGSVRDVDEVLPEVAGLFDLVILDEAAQIDQMNAASSLVRAKRALVCGDPNQLGHTSYVSNDAVERAAKRFGTNEELLNPRSVSTFDITAAQVPAEVLDEHFRSVPHLIEFSSRRFYGGDLHVATRHPRSENADHIHVSVVDGSRDESKVNHAQVDECLRLVEKYAASGSRSIGIISPFRAQADALEESVLEKYRLEEIDAFGLRVGTVHSYQGDERDVLIISLAVGRGEKGTAWRFVNQRNLFNVMVTRAREEVVVVTSDPAPPGLAGEYIEWSEPLTDLTRDTESVSPWVRRIAEALEDQNIAVRCGYRVGRHLIDIVAGTGEHAVAIDCGPHPDGEAMHMDRAMMLRRAGWKTVDAYQTMWKSNPGQFAIELAAHDRELSAP